MLELKINPSNDLDSTGKRVVLVDSTGSYALSTNVGGYGGVNPQRNEVVVYPLGYLISSTGTKTPLKFDPYNPLTATTWNALPPKDGWLAFQLVYAPVVANPVVTAYTEGTILFSSTVGKLIKVKKIGTVLSFVEAKPEELLTLNTSRTIDQLFIANLSIQKINLNEKKIELLIDSENLSNSKKLQVLDEAYNKMRSVLQGAIYQFCIGNKFQAARYIEFLITNNYAQL